MDFGISIDYFDGVPRISNYFNGFQNISTDIIYVRVFWRIYLDFNGFWIISMEFDGFQQISVNLKGFLIISKDLADFDEFRWILLDFNVFSDFSPERDRNVTGT